MTATPTPGDLSARTRLLNCAVDAINDYAALVGDDHDVGTCNCDLVDIANGLAALSALPAAGGAVCADAVLVPRELDSSAVQFLAHFDMDEVGNNRYDAASECWGELLGIAATPAPMLDFSNPVFKPGRNTTVRRGEKWYAKQHARVAVGETILTVRLHTMTHKFSRLDDHWLRDEHDPSCRTVSGLLAEMQRVYPGFSPSETVTLVDFYLPDYTTPPPSAAEPKCDCGSNADNRWPHHDECAIYADAAVGAQGDGSVPDSALWQAIREAKDPADLLPRIIALLQSPREPAAPAAGKGVDGAAALAEFTRYFVKNYPGPDTIIHDPNWHAPRIFRAAQAALTRQPVAGDRLRIEAQPGLDPISVYFEDYAPGSGRMTVACYGEAWTAAWGAMGDRTVRQFVAEIVDEGYLSGAMLSLCGATRRNREYATKVARAVIAALAAPAGTPAIAAITGGES